MKPRPWHITLFLFGSGLCALIYQVTWMRELGFVFGATTAASAAVLAIFMGGIGYGSVVLGKRANRHKKPLVFYAQLELLIAASTALTPLLVWLVRQLYLSVGGSITLGLTVSTVVRLLLSAVVLGFPTFLMGGTLPAAAKSVETTDDVKRRRLAGIYGANTLGAVTGAMLATFLLLEALGLRLTLWIACLFNIAVAGIAYYVGTNAPAMTKEKKPKAAEAEVPATPVAEAATPTTPTFIYAVAAVVGFVFFLMELVWFRMMSPLLGGTTYTFGFVLAMALLGIGLGGAAYAVFGQNRPATLSALAATCGLEAFFLAIPIGLGDYVAVLTAYFRTLEGLGFTGLVFGWSIILAIVVLPTSIVAGYQFPLLVALLGRGRRNVAKHTGMAYACNTGGAIVGSLAGGFGLLPLLGAVTTWRIEVVMLAVTSLVIFVLAQRSRRSNAELIPALVASALAIALLFTTGPTAAWRHSGIGTGRVSVGSTRNEIRGWMNDWRRHIVYQADGEESSIAVYGGGGYSLFNNGGREGAVIDDASTNMWLGLLGAFLHPNPRDAMVIGLATGTTAGWLAQVPDVGHVDVLEMEPAIINVAKLCEEANGRVVDNPKVDILGVDAREFLITAHSKRYDVIASGPSNPYRAGVASLFTKSFYESALNKLKSGGIFLQFVQSYECDVRTMQTIYRTLSSVFPVVETWQTSPDDLLLVCSRTAVPLDPSRLRQRLTVEPFRSGTVATLQAGDIEGILALYVGGMPLTNWLASQPDARVNTDDHNVIDYAFARTLGLDYRWHIDDLRTIARQLGAHRPQVSADDINWEHVEDRYLGMFLFSGYLPPMPDWLTEAQRHRANAQWAYLQNEPGQALEEWQKQEEPPSSPLQLAMIADALARTNNILALDYAKGMRTYQPLEAEAVIADYYIKSNQLDSAAQSLVYVLDGMHRNPWGWPIMMRWALNLASPMAQNDSTTAPILLKTLERPFAANLLNDIRSYQRLSIASQIGLNETLDALSEYEPNIPWTDIFLSNRARWYAMAGSPETYRAQKEWHEYLDNVPTALQQPASQ